MRHLFSFAKNLLEKFFVYDYKYKGRVLDSLPLYLTEEYGRGFPRINVAGMRQFYLANKDREDVIIQSGIGQFEQRQKRFTFNDKKFMLIWFCMQNKSFR